MILEAVLSGFVLAIFAPWIHRYARGATGWILALLPLGLFLYFASFIGPVSHGEAINVIRTWVPSIDVNLNFQVDGLSLLFSLIITGVGTFIIIYASGYLAHDRDIGRFYVYILMFMASMLGVVLSDNLITLFIFWELTSITSFMLIGYYHEKEESRASALQALLTTGAGGLALLAGLVLMGIVGNAWNISELAHQEGIIVNSPLYGAILILVLLGAFTKSAQFPFHFWLPNAMAAPAPVSAYLHSATMVKAGIYLMARFSPILGGTPAWTYTVTTVGAVTMLLAAHIAWQQTDLKRILAYSTVSALGTLTMLLGIGSHVAVEAAMVFLVVHSLYKGSLFMVAGAVDHETGTRFVDKLGGLRRIMPVTAAAAGLAALSMSGIPPFLGFIGKELIYESTLHSHLAEILLTTAAVLANALTIVAAALVAHKPFFGASLETPKHAHEAPFSMWLGPITLAGLGLLLGLLTVNGLASILPTNFDTALVAPAVGAILGEGETHVKLALWHGLNLSLGLSAITIALGVGIYFVGLQPLLKLLGPLNAISKWGPEQWYSWTLNGTLAFGRWQTRVLQNGYLRYYLITIIITNVGLFFYTLFRFSVFDSYPIARPPNTTFYEMVFYIMILAATVVVVTTSSRLTAVAALGVVGFGVALIFIFFGAPDLAMTQFSIETLSVILLVLVLYKLPRFIPFTLSKVNHGRDILVALAGGSMVTLLILVVTAIPPQSRLTPYFTENSHKLAHGNNIVNVILVDFRGFDTLGEITVLSIAAIGVFGLIKLRLDKNGSQTTGITESSGLYPKTTRPYLVEPPTTQRDDL